MDLYRVAIAHDFKFWSTQPDYSPRTLDLLPISEDDIQVSLGMGVHSTAQIVRMLLEPSCYHFDLKRLVVVIAQTGDEFRDTKDLIEQHLFPLMRSLQVRVVQVARHGLYQSSGITVLDDTRSPTTLFIAGDYKLSTELTEAGTVPQVAQGKHTCASKYKGWVIDAWVDLWHEGMAYRNTLGYHVNEPERRTRAQSYTNRLMTHEFPLVAWGWGHEECMAFLWQVFGVEWKKSCCNFCPFTGGRRYVLERYIAEPDGGVAALLMEFGSMALNGNMTLFGSGRSLYDSVEAYSEENDGALGAVLVGFRQRLEAITWGLYRVQRIYYARPDPKKRPTTDRNVELMQVGSRAEIDHALRQQPGEIVESRGHVRSYTRERKVLDRSETTVEEFFVAAPKGIKDKRKPRFYSAWAVHALQQKMF